VTGKEQREKNYFKCHVNYLTELLNLPCHHLINYNIPVK